LNIPTETLETNETKLEFEVESDAGSIDDAMLVGEEYVNRRKKDF